MIKPLDVVYVVSEPNNRAFSHRNLFPLQHYVDGFLHLFHALDGRGMDKKGGGGWRIGRLPSPEGIIVR